MENRVAFDLRRDRLLRQLPLKNSQTFRVAGIPAFPCRSQEKGRNLSHHSCLLRFDFIMAVPVVQYGCKIGGYCDSCKDLTELAKRLLTILALINRNSIIFA